MDTMTPKQARLFWKALMDNTTALIRDAALLLGAGSFGRTRGLLVLAYEELGKASWLYTEFEKAWSAGRETPREVPRLERFASSPSDWYTEALTLARGLRHFWSGPDVEKEDVGNEEDPPVEDLHSYPLDRGDARFPHTPGESKSAPGARRRDLWL